MAPDLIGREVRSVIMHARDPGAVLHGPVLTHFRARRQHGIEFSRRAGRRGGKNTRCAAPQVGAIGGPYRFASAIHVVRAFTAVDVHVHVSWCNIHAFDGADAARHSTTYGSDAALITKYEAGLQYAVGQNYIAMEAERIGHLRASQQMI